MGERARDAVEEALSGIDAAPEERAVIAAAGEISARAVGVVAHGAVRAVIVPEICAGGGVAEEPVGVNALRKDLKQQGDNSDISQTD